MKSFSYITSFIFLVICVGATPVWAAEFDPVSSGMRMLGGLLVVLLIILGLYYVLRKRLSIMQSQSNGAINIIEIKHVQPRKTLLLVEVRGREYLIGSGGDSINTIVPLQQGESFSSHLHTSAKKL